MQLRNVTGTGEQRSRRARRPRTSTLAAGLAGTGLWLAACASPSVPGPSATGSSFSTVPAAPPTSTAIYVPPTSSSTTNVAGGPPGATVGPDARFVVAPHPAASRGVGPPEGSPVTGIRRDCGMSTPLSGGRALWIYCDTGIWGADARLQYFVTTTATVASPDEPLVMRDALDATSRPVGFLTTADDYPVCHDGARRSAWPMSAVTVPGDGSDRVLIWYHNVCLVPRAAETFDIGLAEIVIPADHRPEDPLVAHVVTPRLFGKLGRGGSFGAAAEVFEGDAYVWWCDLAETPCFLARAPLDRVQDLAAYTYWTGAGWGAEQGRMAPLPLGPVASRISSSVRWVPALASFVMLDMDGWGRLDLRFADRPEGPWSAAQTSILEECPGTYPENCFAGAIHAQLSDAAHLAVGYFDPRQPFGTGRSTRVIDIGLTPRG